MTSELPVTIPGKAWSLEARKQMMRDVVTWFDKLGILSLVKASAIAATYDVPEPCVIAEMMKHLSEGEGK